MSESDGRYRLEKQIGRDGIAEVWRGVDLESGRPVTVKFLNGRAAGSRTRARGRGDRKARAATQVGHSGQGRVLDVGHHEGRPFLVMEQDGPRDGDTAVLEATPQDMTTQEVTASRRRLARIVVMDGAIAITLIAVAVWLATGLNHSRTTAAPPVRSSSAPPVPSPSAAPSQASSASPPPASAAPTEGQPENPPLPSLAVRTPTPSPTARPVTLDDAKKDRKTLSKILKFDRKAHKSKDHS